ncbi:hypothetical protein DIPPA_33855 [Diplonema papillatum]|nr:hypothetical protein DIPPA_33855 [Diplonema papillatum]|eukprot:gene10417-16051_t
MRQTRGLRTSSASWWLRGGGEEGSRSDEAASVAVRGNGWGLRDLKERGYAVGPCALSEVVRRRTDPDTVDWQYLDRHAVRTPAWRKVFRAVLHNTQAALLRGDGDPVKAAHLLGLVEAKMQHLSLLPDLELAATKALLPNGACPHEASSSFEEVSRTTAEEPTLNWEARVKFYLYLAGSVGYPSASEALDKAQRVWETRCQGDDVKASQHDPVDQGEWPCVTGLGLPGMFQEAKLTALLRACAQSGRHEEALGAVLQHQRGRVPGAHWMHIIRAASKANAFDAVLNIWPTILSPCAVAHAAVVEACALRAKSPHDVWVVLADETFNRYSTSEAAVLSPFLCTQLLKVYTAAGSGSAVLGLKRRVADDRLLSPHFLSVLRDHFLAAGDEAAAEVVAGELSSGLRTCSLF